MTPTTIATPHPAATVVMLREGSNGVETLLLKRNQKLAFHGGAWVFPGGRIDPEDYTAAGHPTDMVAAGRHAAVREVQEEAGVSITVADLRLFSRWVTPEEAPKRFDALFFLARAGDEPVQVDGGEIHEHRWLRPDDALALHRPGAFDLAPPTFVTLTALAQHRTLTEVFAAVPADTMELFVPQLRVTAEGACCLYAGDAAYGGWDIDVPGPRHRLLMTEAGWRYQRSPAV